MMEDLGLQKVSCLSSYACGFWSNQQFTRINSSPSSTTVVRRWSNCCCPTGAINIHRQHNSECKHWRVFDMLLYPSSWKPSLDFVMMELSHQLFGACRINKTMFRCCKDVELCLSVSKVKEMLCEEQTLRLVLSWMRSIFESLGFTTQFKLTGKL